jgi:hypothetical protein
MDKMDDILAVVGPRRAPILVRLNEFEGRKTIDFRRYFHAKGKEDLLPTQKGVSFDRETFALVQAALNENGDRIVDWLASSSASVLSANQRAVEKLQTELRPNKSDEEGWKSPTFFHVAAEGAIDHLTFNSSHVFTTALEKITSHLDERTAVLVRELLGSVLISYYRSKMLFDGVSEMSAADLFQTLEMNWGIILKRYAEQLRGDE